jgi:hypothetical protein
MDLRVAGVYLNALLIEVAWTFLAGSGVFRQEM